MGRCAKPCRKVRQNRYQPAGCGFCLFRRDLDVPAATFQVMPSKPQEFRGADSGKRLDGKARRNMRRSRGEKSPQFFGVKISISEPDAERRSTRESKSACFESQPRA